MAFTFWIILAVFGQAAMLRLILAGKEMGYQHYLLPGRNVPG